ncbi:shikimate dehydrogenase [Mumia sp. DW29H23]|uniref:shikimate dehydrogenase n=1 Tax=Mumia sp. DW29H23 TaxID=3421241 RepID=UPI003D69B5AF
MRPYLVGLVGAGVAPSLTPSMHMAEAKELGLDYVYRTVDLDLLGIAPTEIGRLVAAAKELGFDALNVTHPCKQLVIEHLDRLSPEAAALGAVNTVVFEGGEAVGHNTDTSGFASALTQGLPDADLDDVVLLGAGGAGAAVGDALLRLGAEHLTVVDLDDARATTLAHDLATRHDARVEAGTGDKISTLLAAATGLVHCTPTGMAAHPGSPVDVDLLDPSTWVADIVYRPLETALVRAARGAGCAVLDGGLMAVYQAVDAFRLVTGTEPDAERMNRHFRALVADAS